MLMFKINFALLLLLIGNTCFSQTDNIWKRKPWEELKYENRQKLSFSNPETKLVTQPENQVSKMPVVKMEITLKKNRSINSTTDLFVVEPYHMPCIGPSKNIISKMPIVGLKFEEDTSPK